MTPGRIVSVLGALAAIVPVAGCGKQDVSVPAGDSTHAGAVLFAEHCSGCHTLSVTGSHGSATKVRDRERVDGPNFDQRKEQPDQVLYAIRNGGFSGAIMPENIVVGRQAQQVAAFLAEYSGRKAKASRAPGH
jgi:mono/diheme cytochrome c family protein